MGRRKIEMKKVENTGALQVTFSKRRNGVFKKANELAILCGAIVAIICFSPGKKPYSFGHPNVDFSRPKGDKKIEMLNKELADVLEKLEIAKRKNKMLDKSQKEMEKENPLFRPINELSKSEVFELKGKLEELRDKVKDQLNDMEASSSLLLLAKEPVFMKKEDFAKDI
ncbi:Agamous-like MADS-box protein [Quillaja saponaria]|uniref:Agamous-like MADS-box protein n=1 Tax=Quillaja saponaria TaxID=32244 RepID=A0AAD7M2R3_QUISA|nr:Agamous-like MADS-box protein [Quillaja saponaria]